MALSSQPANHWPWAVAVDDDAAATTGGFCKLKLTFDLKIRSREVRDLEDISRLWGPPIDQNRLEFLFDQQLYFVDINKSSEKAVCCCEFLGSDLAELDFVSLNSENGI